MATTFDALIGTIARPYESSEPAAVRLVAAEEIVAVDPDLGSFLDIDTPEDLARLTIRGFPPSR